MSDSGAILPVALLEGGINATSRAIENYCGRRFWKDSAPTTRIYKTDDSYIAWVDDIATKEGLIVETDDLGDYTYVTSWSGADFDLGPYNQDVVSFGDEVKPYSWWRIHAVGDKVFPVSDFRATLRVTARFGWSDIPDEVNQACLMKANNIVKRKDAPFGVAGFTEFGAVRISRREDPDVASLLDPYIRIGARDI
jgi:hypothetical protein